MNGSRLFRIDKPIIGMVHLPPLPGSPSYSGQPIEEIVEFAVKEATTLQKGGIDAVLVENYNDYPYCVGSVPKLTLITMATVAYQVKKAVSVPVGVNVLFNDAEAELYLAACLGLDFIRVEGFVDLLLSDLGVLFPVASKLLRLRKELGAEHVAILADVQGKHTQALPPKDVVSSAKDALERGRANAVIVTGSRTGEAVPVELVARIKKALPNSKVFVGSGVTPENIKDVIAMCDGAIVGTYLKKDGFVLNPVDFERVQKLMEVVHKARRASSS